MWLFGLICNTRLSELIASVTFSHLQFIFLFITQEVRHQIKQISILFFTDECPGFTFGRSCLNCCCCDYCDCYCWWKQYLYMKMICLHPFTVKNWIRNQACAHVELLYVQWGFINVEKRLLMHIFAFTRACSIRHVAPSVPAYPSCIIGWGTSSWTRDSG